MLKFPSFFFFLGFFWTQIPKVFLAVAKSEKINCVCAFLPPTYIENHKKCKHLLSLAL